MVFTRLSVIVVSCSVLTFFRGDDVLPRMSGRARSQRY